MKTGDKVLVDRGGLMNGMVGSIEELQELIDTKDKPPPVVYPEAKHDCT